MTENGHKIAFSLTQAISLPQESWYLISENLSKAEIRVTLCVLFNYFEAGSEAAPLSFTEIVEQTKMSKSSVLEGLNAAIERGSVFRKNAHSQTRYEPRFGKIRTHDMINHDSYINHECLPLKDEETCHGSEKSERDKILNVLVRFGLAFHVAFNIAMTNRYLLEDLQNQLLYIFHEKKKGTAPHGRAFFGYVVNRIKFNRFAPADFDKPMAHVEMLMAEIGQTREEIFKAYYDGGFDEIEGLEFHSDYLSWFHQAESEINHENVQ